MAQVRAVLASPAKQRDHKTGASSSKLIQAAAVIAVIYLLLSFDRMENGLEPGRRFSAELDSVLGATGSSIGADL